MDQAAAPQLDRAAVARLVDALRAITDEELPRLLDSWRSAIGVDLVMTRWMLHPDERAAFDRAADLVRAAADARIHATGEAFDETAPERLAEMALGHLATTTWAFRLTQDQRRRMGAPWRLVTPRRTAA